MGIISTHSRSRRPEACWDTPKTAEAHPYALHYHWNFNYNVQTLRYRSFLQWVEEFAYAPYWIIGWFMAIVSTKREMGLTPTYYVRYSTFLRDVHAKITWTVMNRVHIKFSMYFKFFDLIVKVVGFICVFHPWTFLGLDTIRPPRVLCLQIKFEFAKSVTLLMHF